MSGARQRSASAPHGQGLPGPLPPSPQVLSLHERALQLEPGLKSQEHVHRVLEKADSAVSWSLEIHQGDLTNHSFLCHLHTFPLPCHKYVEDSYVLAFHLLLLGSRGACSRHRALPSESGHGAGVPRDVLPVQRQRGLPPMSPKGLLINLA